MPRRSNEAIVLADLTGWFVPSAGGRGRQSTNPQRFILTLADSRNFTVSIERQGYPAIGEKFTDRLSQLPFTAKSLLPNLSIQFIIEKLIEGLKAMNLETPSTENKTPQQIAEELENLLEGNLQSERNLARRLFGDDEMQVQEQTPTIQSDTMPSMA